MEDKETSQQQTQDKLNNIEITGTTEGVPGIKITEG